MSELKYAGKILSNGQAQCRFTLPCGGVDLAGAEKLAASCIRVVNEMLEYSGSDYRAVPKSQTTGCVAPPFSASLTITDSFRETTPTPEGVGDE